MLKKCFKFGLKVLLITFVLVMSVEYSDVLAQGLSDGGSGLSIPQDGAIISSDIDRRPLGVVILSIVNYFIGFLGFLAVLMFVYAGVLWVLSAGNDEQITKAKKIMIYASVGLLVVILSFSAVRFITSSAGGGNTCATDADCPNNGTCSEDNFCSFPQEGGNSCQSNVDCSGDLTCNNGICQLPVGFACLTSADCSSGQYCSADSTCKNGSSETCQVNADCASPEQCDPFGFCHDPNGGSGTECSDNTDCSTGYVCNLDKTECEIQGSGGQGGLLGGQSQGLTLESLNSMDALLASLGVDLGGADNDLKELDEELQILIDGILKTGSLQEKIDALESIVDTQEISNLALGVIQRLVSGLEKLQLVQDEMAVLKGVMPESKKTLEALVEMETSFDSMVSDPTSSIRRTQFKKQYTDLKELILTFPIVQSRIRAIPGEGSAPLTVVFDGLDSFDSTGGTITSYIWSFLDENGNLFTDEGPIFTHEFKVPGTYNVKLQVATNNTDQDGYKMAMDGISNVLVTVRQPTSQVGFNINGREAGDIMVITEDESKSGLEFDPSITVPSPGRTIEKYEWFFGDGQSEPALTQPVVVEHTYNQPGDYFVTLIVTDDTGVRDKRVVKIAIKPLAAVVEVVPETGDVNTEFRFRGIESRSDNGVITDYSWLILDADGVQVLETNDESFTHRFERPGVYDVELTITDTTGAKDKESFQFEVESREPVANFVFGAPRLNRPNSFEFDASNSYDPDSGDQLTFSWDFESDGQFELVGSQDMVTTHEYRRTGVFKATLQVEDAFGKRSQFEANVEVDSILAADIEVDKRAAQLGEEITFSAEGSSAVSYLWDFGDGQTMNTEEETITHSYDEEGKYNVRLNFFDADDNSNVATTYVLAAEGDNPIALADLTIEDRIPALIEDLCGEGKDGYRVTRSDNLSLTGSNSVNRDGSGRLLVYDWRFSDGTRNDRKDFTHRYADLTPVGECESIDLVVQDEITGKLSNEDVLYFQVVNDVPVVRDFVIETEKAVDLITPTKVTLRLVGVNDRDGQVGKYRWWYYREGFENNRLGLHSTSNPQTEIILTAQGQPGNENRFYFVAEAIDNDEGIFETTDRFGSIAYLDVTNGPNLSPVAEFTTDKTTIAVGDSITFVSQSYDPQGDQLPNNAFQWDFDGDGAFDDLTTGAQVNRQFNTPGEFEVRLKVVYRGLSSTARQTIFVEPTNSYPQASFTYGIEGNSVAFDAGNSAYDDDLEDTSLRFEWDFDILDDADGNGVNDDDVQSTEVSPTYIYDDLRLYRAKLTIKDSLGSEGVSVRDVDLNLSSADRARNTRRSVSLKAPEQPITLLNVSVSPFQLDRGSTADIVAQVQNADNTVYSGDVFFELLEGTGEFSPSPVSAIDSKAQTVFTAIDSGAVRIRVTATGTFYGDLVEEMIINVQ